VVRVGLTADWDRLPGGRERLVLDRAYVAWVRKAGLQPVVLPSLPGDEGTSLRGLSGLLLTGGGDIPPSFYGAEPDPDGKERLSHPERTAFEFTLVWRALKAGLPLLGICLGCQTLNVAMGGTLVRHLEDPEGIHRRSSPDAPNPRHRLKTRPGSLIHALYATPDIRVSSSHHQAVGRVADGFQATAWGPGGVVEAIENPENQSVLGVQWHPERTPRSPFSQALARWFAERAMAFAAGER
jgi:gamma-glutamyl-gamma-aminobutyrate hydrolase PuuD